MPQPYRHLDLDERRTIFRLLGAKVPVAVIAHRLGRHRATIQREIHRNHFHEVRAYAGYFPLTAHDLARRRRQRLRKLARNESLRRHVVDRLTACWSPQQIAGRLRRDHLDGASAGAASAASRAPRSSRPSGPSKGGRRRSRAARPSAMGKPIC
jgi:IS30 family transposase